MVILPMYRGRSVKERAVQKWLENAIPIFWKNITALKELNELVNEWADTCTHAPDGFHESGIRQHSLDTLNDRRLRIHNGHDYDQSALSTNSWSEQMNQKNFWTMLKIIWFREYCGWFSCLDYEQ